MNDRERYKEMSKYSQSSVRHLSREMTLTCSQTGKETFKINKWEALKGNVCVCVCLYMCVWLLAPRWVVWLKADQVLIPTVSYLFPLLHSVNKPQLMLHLTLISILHFTASVFPFLFFFQLLLHSVEFFPLLHTFHCCRFQCSGKLYG